jgi:signal peptidase II
MSKERRPNAAGIGRLSQARRDRWGPGDDRCPPGGPERLVSSDSGVGTRDALARAIGRRHRRELRARWQLAGALALAVFVLDQITKIVIRATLEPRDSIAVFPGFDISRFRNEGIAFSLFTGRQTAIAILTVVALVGIGLALIRLVGRNSFVAAGAGLLIGGSLGNLVDRIWRGGVTDFLDPARWPAFNVADVGIVCGAGLIVFGLMREADEPADDEPAEE